MFRYGFIQTWCSNSLCITGKRCHEAAEGTSVCLIKGLKNATRSLICVLIQHNKLGSENMRRLVDFRYSFSSHSVNGGGAIAALHVRLSAFISLNPLFFIPSAVTQLKIGCRRHSAASARSPSVRFCTD